MDDIFSPSFVSTFIISFIINTSFPLQETTFFEQHHNDGVPGIFGSAEAHDEMTAQQYGKHLESVMEHFTQLNHNSKEHDVDFHHHDIGSAHGATTSHHVTEQAHALDVDPVAHHNPVNMNSKFCCMLLKHLLLLCVS